MYEWVIPSYRLPCIRRRSTRGQTTTVALFPKHQVQGCAIDHRTTRYLGLLDQGPYLARTYAWGWCPPCRAHLLNRFERCRLHTCDRGLSGAGEEGLQPPSPSSRLAPLCPCVCLRPGVVQVPGRVDRDDGELQPRRHATSSGGNLGENRLHHRDSGIDPGRPVDVLRDPAWKNRVRREGLGWQPPR